MTNSRDVAQLDERATFDFDKGDWLRTRCLYPLSKSESPNGVPRELLCRRAFRSACPLCRNPKQYPAALRKTSFKSFSVIVIIANTASSFSYSLQCHFWRLTMTRKRFPSRSSMKSICGYSFRARRMPVPRPRYGKTLFAYELKIGLRMFEFPLRIFATVRLFGR